MGVSGKRRISSRVGKTKVKSSILSLRYADRD